SDGNKTSRINVVLPEPLTPVTHTKRLSGISTVRFLRLWSEAPVRVKVGQASCLSGVRDFFLGPISSPTSRSGDVSSPTSGDETSPLRFGGSTRENFRGMLSPDRQDA